jgi:CBS domain-containing protein
MKVSEIMTSPVVKVAASAAVSEAAKIMAHKDIGTVLVEENMEIVGIVTERDIVNKVVAHGRDPDRTMAEDIMSTPIILINSEKSVEEANELMNQKKVRRLPVEKEGEIVGMITLKDVSNSLKETLRKARFRI